MKRFLIFIFVIAATGLGLWYAQVLYRAQHQTSNAAPQVSTSLFERLDSENFFPEPLRKLTGQSSTNISTLDAREVVQFTNIERANNGKKPLKENDKLALAAHRKIADMIALQYFEHKSPSGKGPADIIEATGYTYVVVGENLAEGDFISNADLVQGWMNSPGHRANILNDKYTEIGVATEQGTLNGKKVWFAVQEFGRPLTDCPRIDQSLKVQIASNESQAQALQRELQQVQTNMNQAKQSNNIDKYNSLVPTYNSIANRINELVAKTKEIVTLYNAQVKSFNTCIE